ncbi:HD-GYP domain-containing protein [Candidatus Weimeria sp. HCP3S3_B5]|uniref:HD-GYP domain-containing protein n=1 Tax=Candidatus Weimeria sp. HCP3S3_B5 TaxID=3438871 RepID=UPI002A996779|nr:HD-GYP domain-containing protein [Lachnospiraceae bacterium]MDY6351686.1 HD-GYP domain-containing protein [Lachnospiraceae bacterium]
MGRRRFVSTRTVHPGDKIDQTIIDRTGRAMIKKGAYLDDIQIEYLQQRGIMGIYIYEGVPDEIEEQINIPEATKKVIEKYHKDDPAKVSISNDVKQRVGQGVAYLFNDNKSKDFTRTTNSIADDLSRCILSNSSIAIDVRTIKTNDEYTFRHSVDVATISAIIGQKYGLDRKQLHELLVAGLLHDMGKSEIPNEILNKPARLTDQEFEIMKSHSLLGYNILKEKHEFSPDVLLGVLQHHEKISGKGYPMGVHGDKIGLYPKIIAVADIYDALVTKRPYKEPFSQREAMEMILAMGDDLDFKALECFSKSVILYPVDSVVKLSNGLLAKVVANNPDYPMRPKVVEIETGRVLDLANDFQYNNIVLES